MLEFIAVGIGGFIGCCIRFGLIKGLTHLNGNFPITTLICNVAAGFIIGVIIILERHTTLISDQAKLFLSTGMLGGLTSFATFSLETINLFYDAKYAHATVNVLFNVAFSFLGVILGMSFARIFIKT